MNIRNEICNLLDRGEKGYVTIGDVGVATVHIAFMIVVTHLMYCSISIWQTGINPIILFKGDISNFSFCAQIGYFLSLALMITIVAFCCVLLLSKLEDISSIKISKCRRKQK